MTENSFISNYSLLMVIIGVTQSEKNTQMLNREFFRIGTV